LPPHPPLLVGLARRREPTGAASCPSRMTRGDGRNRAVRVSRISLPGLDASCGVPPRADLRRMNAPIRSKPRRYRDDATPQDWLICTTSIRRFGNDRTALQQRASMPACGRTGTGPEARGVSGRSMVVLGVRLNNAVGVFSCVPLRGCGLVPVCRSPLGGNSKWE
jgi:hypothetical protein